MTSQNIANEFGVTKQPIPLVPLSKLSELFGFANLDQVFVRGDESWLPPITVALEGIIGGGKSELCKTMRTAPGWRVFEEKFSTRLLKLFYDNPNKYGITLQLVAAIKQILQYKYLDARTPVGALYNPFVQSAPSTDGAVKPLPNPPNKRLRQLWDRSLLGNFIIATANLIIGNLSPEEFCIYFGEITGVDMTTEELLASSLPALLAELPIFPTSKSYRPENAHIVFAFILASAETAKANVAARGDPAEQNIDLSYYELLEDLHLSVLLILLAGKERYIGKEGRVLVFRHEDLRDKHSIFLERLYQPQDKDGQFAINILPEQEVTAVYEPSRAVGAQMNMEHSSGVSEHVPVAIVDTDPDLVVRTINYQPVDKLNDVLADNQPQVTQFNLGALDRLPSYLVKTNPRGFTPASLRAFGLPVFSDTNKKALYALLSSIVHFELTLVVRAQ